jgi:hypothetical protein
MLAMKTAGPRTILFRNPEQFEEKPDQMLGAPAA